MVNIKTGFIILIILFAGVAAYAATGDYYDFAAEEISASPSSPAVNQESIITIKIKNAGTNKLFTSAGTNTYNYQFDNFLMTEVNFTSPSYDNIISSSGYLYYTIKGKFLSSGEKNLVFTIDTGKELTESNEDNNSVTKKITVVAAGGVDLSVDSITLDSEEPLVNNSVTLTVSLKNSGTVSLTSSVGLAEEDILMNFSGFTIDSQSRSNYPATANPLNPGSAFKYTYKGKFFKTGTNSLFFQLDRNNRLAETNENNNSLTATKSVYLTEEEADTFELTDITVSSVSSTSVAVSWKTSKGTTGKVNYKEKIYEILESEAASSAATTTHKITLANLKADTTYYYRVVAVRDSVTRDSGYKEFKTTTNGSASAAAGADSSSAATESSASSSASDTQNSTPSSSAQKETASSSGVSAITIADDNLYARLKGRIILKVESKGEAYYIHPQKMYMYYLGRPSDAFEVMRGKGIGITNFNLSKIAVGLSNLSGVDSDGDGLPNSFEDAIGSDKTKSDTDGDGHNDKVELGGGYSPLAKNTELPLDSNFAASQKGKIFLQIEGKGEAWYVNPADGKRYFLGRPEDAFSVMRKLGLGVSNGDFNSL